MKSCGNVILI